jgi:type II secretory pathway pseudopilin PulG
MKRLATLMMAGLVLAGCKKLTDTTPDPDEKPQIIPKGTGNLSVGNGSGGASQAVRKAAARTANDAQLNQLHLFISQAYSLNDRVPNANEIMQEIRTDGQLVALIKEEVIILTNNTQPEGIWAYTQWPQRNANHYIVTRSGRQEMSPADLRQALQAQGTTPKLSQ